MLTRSKVGIISDIHGNADALRAVLDVAHQLDVSNFLVLGDIVGYYYEPSACLDLLCSLDAVMIRGNHETLLQEVRQDASLLSDLYSRYGSGHRIALEKLSSSQLDLLVNLPDSAEWVGPAGEHYLLCHGSPWDPNLYIYPDSEKNILERALAKYQAVFSGHTHYQFEYRGREGLFLNPGSVGQPRDTGRRGACWAIYDTESHCSTLMDTPYDKQRLFDQIEFFDPKHPYLRTVLGR